MEWLSIDLEVLSRLGMAVITGLLVGLERQIRDKPAGLRTMMLICVGACVFTLVSEKMGGAQADPTRIAAQVVTGVGFLGAGAILRDARAVYGMTTAATIWMLAALGMACGFGKLSVAFWGAITTLAVLVIFHHIVAKIDFHRQILRYRFATDDPTVCFDSLDCVFDEAKLRVLRRRCYRDHQRFVYVFHIIGPEDVHRRLRERLMHSQKFELLK